MTELFTLGIRVQGEVFIGDIEAVSLEEAKAIVKEDLSGHLDSIRIDNLEITEVFSYSKK